VSAMFLKQMPTDCLRDVEKILGFLCMFLNKSTASSWLWDCHWRSIWLWSRGRAFIPREV